MQSFEVSPLVTFNDYAQTNVNNAVNNNNQNNKNYRAYQRRLNHKTFSYHVAVNSNQNQPAIVRVFIGPKVNQNGNPLNSEQQRQNMVLLDKVAVQRKLPISLLKNFGSLYGG